MKVSFPKTFRIHEIISAFATDHSATTWYKAPAEPSGHKGDAWTKWSQLDASFFPHIINTCKSLVKVVLDSETVEMWRWQGLVSKFIEKVVTFKKENLSCVDLEATWHWTASFRTPHVYIWKDIQQKLTDLNHTINIISAVIISKYKSCMATV